MIINELVEQKASSIHHRGIYAYKDIPEDTMIIEYLGEKLTQKQADKRADEEKKADVYFFQLNSRTVLDGDIANNPAKFINYTCEPNCYSDIKKGRIYIYALRDIKAGEELSYDYGFARPGWEEHPCYCGSKNCFGFIVAREHWTSIRRTKRYQALMAERNQAKSTS